MVHPICAPARLPHSPPDGETSLKVIGDLVALGAKATAELSSAREAYRAVACVRRLLELQISSTGEWRVPRD
ncbi:hypothetical protein [Variovorax sp. GT1P44]|uniref:hypothetical protein n=1 Tax=Variovorax sp. GT1P44 TaxID=3443742 RepID=UPI003F455210